MNSSDESDIDIEEGWDQLRIEQQRELFKKCQQIFKNIKNDGGFHLGIASGIDLCPPPEMTLALHKDHMEMRESKLVYYAMSYLPPEHVSHPFWGGVLQAGLSFIFANKVYTTDVNKVRMVDKFGPIQTLKAANVNQRGIGPTIIIGTKITWLCTNHHTGQESLTSYSQRIYKMLIEREESDAERAKSIMHAMGHWADTNAVLKHLGYPNVKNSVYLLTKGHELMGSHIAGDLALRLKVFPSGTGRIGLACAIIRKAIAAPALRLVASQEDLSKILSIGRKILSDPLAYHVNCQKIAENPKGPFDISSYSVIIDRLFMFAMVSFKNSSIARSPAFPKSPQLLEFYDETLVNALNSYAISAATKSNAVADEILKENETKTHRLDVATLMSEMELMDKVQLREEDTEEFIFNSIVANMLSRESYTFNEVKELVLKYQERKVVNADLEVSDFLREVGIDVVETEAELDQTFKCSAPAVLFREPVQKTVDESFIPPSNPNKRKSTSVIGVEEQDPVFKRDPISTRRDDDNKMLSIKKKNPKKRHAKKD